MVATRGRTFKRPWRRSCLSSKLKSSSAPIGRKDSWCFHAVGSSNAPLLGSTAAEGLPRIGRTSIATRWRFCGLPQSASCSENFVIPPDVFGQTLRRRQFIITLLGGAAAAWPLATRAQQDTLRLVGVLAGFSEDEMRPLLAAFRSRMSQLGWIEGRSLAIDLRLGAGDHRRTTAEARALVGRKPDVILAMGTPGLTAVRQHSDSVPVVFTLVADPVSTGMIESLARPGGNVTGFTNFEFSIGGKC